jgi:predicted 3-demethylubiquinone-9 3-methyltransferase (glyoxalase superfamily)
MKKITPHLWFDKEARDAAELYVSVFPGSRITHLTRLKDTPSGDCDVVSFELAGQPFMAINAGPLFHFNPSVSFQARCANKDEVDEIWGKLSPGGKALMPLQSYPFSERYGWLEDRYGLSWQVMLTGGGEIKQKIAPALMFTGSVYGKTEEAVEFYASVFRDAPGSANGGETKTMVGARYGRGDSPDKEGAARYAQLVLRGQEFAGMDSARGQHAFNEAISFLVPCENQEEIDYFWEKLAADPNAGQCGWLKDRYGLSWQVAPTVLGELLGGEDKERRARVTQAFLKMKKFDIGALRRAAG